MKQAYVLGHHISHSKSPLIHRHWLEHTSIDGRYDVLDIAPEALADTMTALRQNKDFVGCNVTMPHKQKVMAYLDDIDETARAIGAVNTIYYEGEKLTGTNTDAYGFCANLKEHVEGARLQAAKKGVVHIIGAGGAARAVLYGLIQEGFRDFVIQNRTREKAEALAFSYEKDARFRVIDETVINPSSDVSLLINTSSLGMAGHPPLNSDLKGLDLRAIVIDIVYNPLYTKLLLQAQVRNLHSVTGIGMLLHQARPAFKHFFGIYPQADTKADHKLKELVLEK